jgi:hypothetical protein
MVLLPSFRHAIGTDSGNFSSHIYAVLQFSKIKETLKRSHNDKEHSVELIVAYQNALNKIFSIECQFVLTANITLAAAFTITFKNFSSTYLMSRLVHDMLRLVMELGSILIKITLYVLLEFCYLTDFCSCSLYNVSEFM